MVPVLRAALQIQKGEARGTRSSRPSRQSLPTEIPSKIVPPRTRYFFFCFRFVPSHVPFLTSCGLACL